MKVKFPFALSFGVFLSVLGSVMIALSQPLSDGAYIGGVLFLLSIFLVGFSIENR